MSFRVEQHLDALRDPACFGGIGAVEVIQTHISVVCLAGDRAFKFKKAVALPFVDFSTPALREHACRDELRLNRRLARDVYLAVEPLRRTGDGALRVGDRDGEVVDWCVVMARLPQERMLDRLLAENAVGESDVRHIARIVADFHRRVAQDAGDEVREAGSPDRLIRQIRANFAETEPMVGACFDTELHARTRRRVEEAMPELRRRLAARAAAGRVVEGHGDLHARNICLVEPPAIYDCLEFRLDFRAGDVATDIAFLVMDLRYRGHRELADAFVAEYAKVSGDDELRAVLPELVRYRAMVRAKVDALAHADTGIGGRDRQAARRGARRHLRLCAWTFVEARPLVVVGCGLPASGKSTVLDALAREAGWPRISTDATRKELAGVAADERLDPSCYLLEFSDRTYDEVIRRVVAAPGSAIADGNFPTAARRRAIAEAARAAGRRVAIVEVRVPEAVARDRLRQRAHRGGSISDADESVFDRLRSGFVRPDDAVVIDGAAPVEDALDRLAVRLLEMP